MINFGAVPIGSVLPVFFDSFAGATGASITLTGLAITDVEIFKGTSMTQRTPDTGVVLIDTDGIDLDGITGIHGFSIDTGDNTDAGFFAAGSFYTVVVSAVTIDTQTVNFVAATFRLLAAEHTAGYPVATIKDGTGTGEINTNGGKVVGVELVDVLTTYTGNTPQTGDVYVKVDTEIASILAAVDTEVADIQSRLPAALIGGRMECDVEAINANTNAADALQRSALGIVRGTVDAASSTTSIVTSSLSPAAAVIDQFKGRIVTFDSATTTANLRGQSTDITGNTAPGVLTVTALTDAPVSGDTFTIN